MSDTDTNSPAPAACPLRSILRGSLGFGLVSLAAFSVWAFGGGWFRGRGGEPAMYVAIAAVFVVFTGVLLHPLVQGPRRLLRFYQVFVPAFLLYSIVWSGFWFWLKYGLGEWLGAGIGSMAFVAYSAWRFGSWRAFWLVTVVFFVLHTAGYFAGGMSMAKLSELAREDPVPFLDKPQLMLLAKMSWGLFYGLGFGAGLGYVYHSFQKEPRPRPSDAPGL